MRLANDFWRALINGGCVEVELHAGELDSLSFALAPRRGFFSRWGMRSNAAPWQSAVTRALQSTCFETVSRP